MAYVLGFFVADGCISESSGRKNNPYTVTITSKDLELLEDMKKALSSEYKISKKFGSAGTIAHQLQFRNLAMANDLIGLGVYPRKTYHLPPVKVPDPYFADFVRGFFDGDGSVYIYNVNSVPQIKSSFICTSLEFITDFNTRLCRALGIPNKSIHVSIGREAGYMTKFSNCFYVDDSEKLAAFMYGNSPSLYLKRKKDIFEQWKLSERRHFVKKNYPSKIGWQLNKKAVL